MENVLAEMSTLNILKVVHSPSKTAQLEPFQCFTYTCENSGTELTVFKDF